MRSIGVYPVKAHRLDGPRTLTTAEIVYRRPDRRWLLQTYVWQDYDMFPNFPALKDFLAFWKKSLEGPLFAVTVAHSKLIKPAELHAVDGVFRLH